MREAVSAQVAIGRPEASRGRPLYRLLFDAIRYYLVLLFFAIGMVLFLAGIVTCTIAGSREWRGRATRYAIHLGASMFFWGMEALGMLTVRGTAARGMLWDGPAIVVANHPSMLDALLLLARVPQGVCIMKGSLIRTPLVSTFAKMAGYIWQQTPEQVIRQAAERLAQGVSLVIFPEGTRSPAGGLGEIKRGASRLAVETGARLQVLGIRMKPVVLGRGQRWWVPPAFPVHCELEGLGILREQPELVMSGDDFGLGDPRKRVFWLTKQLEVALRNSV